ncbi:MAG: hypothetical protein NZ960_07540 [Candidatus Kapabacteria bacterium]|nr:hypothetical protein [Candidatus Kapabacteria bacterium]MDW8012833.1 hypothetical protein [Bacteroidota bacterium]
MDWLEQQRYRWQPAAEWLRAELPESLDGTLLVGSGATAMFSDAPLWRCPYTVVPGFPAPTVDGHPGILELRWIGRAGAGVGLRWPFPSLRGVPG